MSSDATVDIISNLPKNVIETILMYLPLKDAIRTSILSRDWRYAWISIPHIAFTWTEFPLPEGESQNEYDHRLVKIIYEVLLLHHGPIHKFELSVDLVSSRDIDRWILFLTRNGIKEIILEKWEGQEYKLPTCIFSCEGIARLKLYRCIVIPAPYFKGFPNLMYLHLSSVIISKDELEALITICPHLKKVYLKDINGCNRLKICSSSLVDLSIEGEYLDIYFEHAPVLTSLHVKISKNNNADNATNHATCKLFKVLDSLPSIEKLQLDDGTFGTWAVGDVPVQLPIICHLKYFSAAINFEDMQEMLTVFSLFRSSPLLSKLNIWACSSKNGNEISMAGFWDAQESFNCLFSHLRSIKMTGIMGFTSELMFIKFILASAPILETVHVKFNRKVDAELSILKEMLRFRRMSAEAEIFYRECQLENISSRGFLECLTVKCLTLDAAFATNYIVKPK